MSLENLNAQEKHIIYSRDVLHAHSRGVQKILDLELHYISDCEERYKNGENIVWTSFMIDSPLVYASGATPLATSELSRLGSEECVELSEDLFQIPRDLCSMVKTMLPEFYLRREIGVKRILHTSKSCEPMNAIFQQIVNFGYDMFAVDYGYRYDDMTEERFDTYVKYISNEYLKASRWLNPEGKELDLDKLLEEMKRYNRVVRKVRIIMNLRRQHNTYIRSLATMFMLMGIGHLFGRPDEYELALDWILEEMSELKPGEFHDPSRIPVVWSGGRGMEFGAYEALDNAGGFTAAFSINNSYQLEFDLTLPPLEAFVKFQVGGRHSGSSNPACHELERAYDEVGAKGIVQYTFNGCSFGGPSSELTRTYFKKLGVPMLTIDSTYQVGEPSGQTLTRVKAFMEMLA